ncbi:MAG: ribosomal protein S18-alanine N-acetyltransferase [Candidatus Riflebacteria bacterium]|nr:ribosomal protein S18-alanine N-acetyltransferase [Candidatus Riflebacteria bacterium]
MLLDISFFEEIKKIENESFDFPWNEETILKCLNLPEIKCFGIVDSSQLCAFSFVLPKWKSLHVAKFAVKKNSRRKGLGMRLMNEIKSFWEMKRGKEITLEVRSKNLTAIKFYLNFGFSICGKINKYYADDGDDAVKMKYVIPHFFKNFFMAKISDL